MVQFTSIIKRFIKPYYYTILIVSLIIIFILIAVFVYNRHTATENFDMANDSQREDGIELSVYFFRADWCPHCKKAEPEWNSFSQTNNGKILQGYKINCVDVNCTNEEDSDVTTYINKFNIQGYPTIKMIKDGKTIDFESRITTSSLNTFLESMLSS
jgi:thiol-disulfide isomerase/thioredoxin